MTKQIMHVLAAVIVAAVAVTRPAAAKPNIIVIFTDDQGYADLGCQEMLQDLKTPHLDRLAADGVRCTSGYVTAPQCVPSRAGILAGRYQQRFGVDHNGKGPLPLSERTIADRLRAAGYVTGMVGKWHLDPNHTCHDWIKANLPDAPAGPKAKGVHIPGPLRAKYLPESRGFTDYFCGNINRYRTNFKFDGTSTKPQDVTHSRFRLDVQSDAAVAFIDRNKDKPFFLYLAYFAPHVPLEATEKYLERFPGEMPERRRYCLAMMSAIDDGVGRILDRLEQHGLHENTLIMFISDNGAPLKIQKEDRPISYRGGAWDGSLNDPWMGEKGMLTEGGIRVPFLVTWPGTIPAGKTYEQPVISLDVGATALALAGLPATPELDGVNLIPHLTGTNTAPPHEVLFWRFWNQTAVRKGKWKYLQAGGEKKYLFDLESSEHETKNLIKEHPAIAAELEAALQAWAKEQKDPGVPAGPLNVQEVKFYDHYLPKE